MNDTIFYSVLMHVRHRVGFEYTFGHACIFCVSNGLGVFLYESYVLDVFLFVS